MDSDINRFYLGGTTGVRGYNSNEFVGRNRALINFEDRIFTYKSILAGIFEPGFVLFVDAGEAWNNFSGDTFQELHTSFGFGIRMAILKAPGISLIRMDYGIPLDLNRTPVLTIGMEGFF
jgi:hemolysin activation/secretion protein